MKIKWIVGLHEKTWVESNEDINVIPVDIPLLPGSYVVGGDIANPYRIRIKGKLGEMRPAELEQKGKSYWVKEWELV